ncbi:MAG: FeoA domain-containing protein [Candidatus Aminicenantes bacterium]|nr:FeoA domain-containing protein [Candidatus Aminicenantes bacterium]
MTQRVVRLVEAPQGVPLRIIDLVGGPGVRRRLLNLGFHPGDLIERNSNALFGGPVLVKNLTTGTNVALGLGIAQKILVEIVDDQT